jgi:hypothetical protein
MQGRASKRDINAALCCRDTMQRWTKEKFRRRRRAAEQQAALRRQIHRFTCPTLAAARCRDAGYGSTDRGTVMAGMPGTHRVRLQRDPLQPAMIVPRISSSLTSGQRSSN